MANGRTQGRPFKFGRYELKGWRDYEQANPFPTEYETWKEWDQKNYEIARLLAANYELATGYITKKPPSVHDMIETTRPIGFDPIPRERK